MLLRSSVARLLSKGRKKRRAVANYSLFTIHYSLKWPVAHATRGAQCRDDGGDDAADDLEDGLPRFLVVLHGVRWFLGVNNFFD